MELKDWEGVCARAGIRQIEARHTQHGKILLGEKMAYYYPHGPDQPVPYYQTFWAIERSECEHAMFVRNDAYTTKNGVYRATTEDERVADAMEQADIWVREFVKVGAYA